MLNITIQYTLNMCTKKILLRDFKIIFIGLIYIFKNKMAFYQESSKILCLRLTYIFLK